MKTGLLVTLKRHGILIAFALILLGMSILSPDFSRPDNLLNIVRQTSLHGIMAVGMTFVILTGGIDLSVGSILALCGLLSAALEEAQGRPTVLQSPRILSRTTAATMITPLTTAW